MKALPRMLAYAMAYIAGIHRSTEDDEENDVKALEYLAYLTNEATPEEIEALKEAALEGAQTEAAAGHHDLANAYREIVEDIEDKEED